MVELAEVPKSMPMQNNPNRVEGDVDMETTEVDLWVLVAPLLMTYQMKPIIFKIRANQYILV
jgi:hypothetical protein